MEFLVAHILHIYAAVMMTHQMFCFRLLVTMVPAGQLKGLLRTRARAVLKILSFFILLVQDTKLRILRITLIFLSVVEEIFWIMHIKIKAA